MMHIAYWVLIVVAVAIGYGWGHRAAWLEALDRMKDYQWALERLLKSPESAGAQRFAREVLWGRGPDDAL